MQCLFPWSAWTSKNFFKKNIFSYLIYLIILFYSTSDERAFCLVCVFVWFCHKCFNLGQSGVFWDFTDVGPAIFLRMKLIIPKTGS